MKWTSTRSESFLCDAQARDNVTEAELALDKEGNFVGLRVKTIAAIDTPELNLANRKSELIANVIRHLHTCSRTPPH